MKKIIIKVDGRYDIAEVSEFIEENLPKYERMFFKWLHNTDNDHGLWTDKRKRGLKYDSQDFIDYLNKYVVDDGSICRIIERDCENVPSGLPSIWF